MKFIFILLCLLLMFYNFETTHLLSKRNNDNFVMFYKLTKSKYLLHIFPHNVHILIDKNSFYLYLENDNEDTYVPAINLQTNYKVNIVNFRYLRDWIDFSPKIIEFSNSLEDIIDIINSVLK